METRLSNLVLVTYLTRFFNPNPNPNLKLSLGDLLNSLL